MFGANWKISCRKARMALHELLREPTGDSANDDGCNPADLLFFHLDSLLMGSEVSVVYRFAVFPDLILVMRWRAEGLEGSFQWTPTQRGQGR